MTADAVVPPALIRRGSRARPFRALLGAVGAIAIGWLTGNIFLAIAYYPEKFASSSVLMALVGMVAGLGGAAALFYFANVFVESLSQRASQLLIPYVFLIPGFGMIAIMLLYPTVQTINYSFANDDSTRYVGFANYLAIFQWDQFWQSILNNALWLLLVPAVTVAIGIVVALFADRLSERSEKIAKMFIFMPMAISFVAASTIWGVLIYGPDEVTGLLNAIVVSLGGEPQNWVRVSTARLNSILMMIILIWMQAGFAMVLLSGAIKGVPEETLEAARIDGASEPQIFFQVIIPQIKGTIITVFITVVIAVLKVFDIVYVLTNGQNKSNVIANLFYQRILTDQKAGEGSAIVVILLLLVTPVLIYQVRHYRKEQGQ